MIADEAHRCAGPEAGLFATVLDATKIRARRRLFMTATPRLFTGRVKTAARQADYEVASMDDPERFGPVFHRLPFGKAIEQDLLSDYRVAVVGVSDETYRDYAERGVFVTLDGKTVTDARTLASQLGLLRAMAQYDLHRVVTFHVRVANARRFATTLPQVNEWMPDSRRPAGTLWAEHVSGEMSSGYRHIRINRLRNTGNGERGLLANARCLNEGVDVPTLDGVAFIDTRRSSVDIVQAVGRAIRRADDKTLGTIVIPVFVDENADPEQALASSEFKRVWEVVNALRAHDDVLADELDGLRRAVSRRASNVGRPAKIHFDLPVGVGSAFARAFDAKLVTTTTSSWEVWFDLLRQFTDREGHARVPPKHIEDGYRLGGWVGTMRAAYQFRPKWDSQAGRRWISDEQIARLESLPDWTWDAQETRWETSISLLERFAAREGHSRVPPSHIEEGFALGRWIREQRNAHRKYPHRLSKERLDRLHALPGWSWGTYQDADWEATFSALEVFVTREGHARVRFPHIEQGHKLGQWVRSQRARYRQGQLPPERAARLVALPGWVWSELEADWEARYAALERYGEREGNTRVPRKHVEEGFRLGEWVYAQRRVYLSGKMTPDRISRLEALPGWVWSVYRRRSDLADGEVSTQGST